MVGQGKKEFNWKSSCFSRIGFLLIFNSKPVSNSRDLAISPVLRDQGFGVIRCFFLIDSFRGFPMSKSGRIFRPLPSQVLFLLALCMVTSAATKAMAQPRGEIRVLESHRQDSNILGHNVLHYPYEYALFGICGIGQTMQQHRF